MASHDKRKSTKKRPFTDIPPSMQFFKWSGMDKLPQRIIDRFQARCYGDDPEENEWYFKLMTYHHKQTAWDKAYKEKKLQEAQGEGRNGDAGPSSSSNDSKEVEKPADLAAEESCMPEQADEVQFLLERKRVLEQALQEQDREECEGVEETEGDQEATTTTKEQEIPRYDSTTFKAPPPVPFEIASPIPFDPLQSPRMTIKRETPEEPAATTFSAPPAAPAATAAAIPTVPTAAVVAPNPLLHVKIEEPSVTCQPLQSPPLSTVAVADEPLTARKEPKSEWIPSTPKAAEQLPAAHSDAAASRIVQKPAVAKTVNQPAAATQQQSQYAATLAQKSQPAAAGMPSMRQLQRASRDPKSVEDPIKVSILSRNLVKLNQQIDYINKIKDLARKQELASEMFYIAVDQFGDPSPHFKLRNFQWMTNEMLKVVDEIDGELFKFKQPGIDIMTKTLKVVKKEIESICQQAVMEIKKHQEENSKLPKELQKQSTSSPVQQTQQQPMTTQQRQEQPVPKNTRLQILSNGRNSSMKRLNADAATNGSVMMSTEHPAAKKTRKTLLQTPYPVATVEAAVDADADQPASTSEKSLIAPAVLWIGICAFCNGTHEAVQCHVYKTYEEREKQREELKLCWHCLRKFEKFHRKKCARKGLICTHCRNHCHHPALCRHLNKPQRKEKNRFKSFFTDSDMIIQRAEPQEDGATFSPIPTPIYEDSEKVEAESPQISC